MLKNKNENKKLPLELKGTDPSTSAYHTSTEELPKMITRHLQQHLRLQERLSGT